MLSMLANKGAVRLCPEATYSHEQRSRALPLDILFSDSPRGRDSESERVG
jgi:hypothetical protein